MANTPTAAITSTEFLDYMSLVDGGVFPALAALIDLLKANIPTMTAALNVAKSWTGQKAISEPKSYGVAPGTLNDKFINSVLVGASTSTTDHGPGSMLNTSQVVVYSVGKRIEIDEQVADAHYRAAVIRGVLRHYLTGYVDTDGLYLWKLLKPTGVSFLPEPFVEYSGVACYYDMVQPPGVNFWSDL